MSTQYAAPDYLGNEVTPWAPTQGPYDNPSSTAGPPPKPPILRSENELSISHPKWGLVDDIVSGFAAANVHEMYPWQSECLSLPEVLQGDSNLVYTAPTSAGKSLVSDILMAKRVMEDFKKVLIVVPYVMFRGIRVPVGKRWRNATAVGFFSGVGSRARWKDIDVAVCTLERANAIINTAIEDRTIDDVGLVVFDELHMVDDEHRGFILEILAAKLLCLGNKIQIVGMSATLSNADTLGKWLKAQRELPTSDKKDMKDPVTNAAIMLTQECVSSGHGVLIFCESRAKCEDLATLMRRYIPRAPSNIEEKRRHILTELGTTAVGLDPVLEKVIPAGIAFHHAGLTSEERDIITMAYQEGTIKIIFCTATIAAGVNLPARRVIIIPHQGRDFVTATTLQQMRGRAGRKGKDTAGETFILVREKDVGPLTKLLTQPLPIVKSALLTSDTTRLSRAILEVIATHLATSTGHILPTTDLIRRIRLLHPTTLGRATVTAGLTPTDGLFLNAELSVALQIDPLHLRQLFEALDEPSLRAALLCGVQPASITRLQPVENRIHQTIYVSLMLRQLINETRYMRVGCDVGQFLRVMGWTGLKVLVACYSGRLEGGVKEELLALARLPGVKSVVARRLWEKGLRTVEAVAEAEVAVVVEALELALPRKVQGADGRLKERAEGIKKAAQRLVELEQRDWEEE
ncbi:P-loop containing nucleoside triphosphate hydrolase protein [Pyronema omphalodes]|nr:P-loop containing nucleoside triphosphate hydrolase protein [Pyronema omphalodes]